MQAYPPEIDLYPDFQRKDNLWTATEQSRLIESILLRFPLPSFYFSETDENVWQVIDGLQRLSTLRNFMIDRNLRLQNLEFLPSLNGKIFDELTKELKRRIYETQIVAYIISQGTPNSVKIHIISANKHSWCAS